MIFLSAPRFDPGSTVRIVPLSDSALHDISRRMNRIPTLDGGAVINDTGHAVADRQMTVVFDDAALYDPVARLLKLYPRLILANREGVFSVAPERLVRRSGRYTLTLLVMEKLSA